MKKAASIIFCLMTLGLALKGQHFLHQSQYMHNLLIANPAYTGSREALSITGSFRKQWLGIEGSPSSETILIHGTTKKQKNNFGAAFVRDAAGLTRQTTATGSYAYRLQLGKNLRLAFGLNGGIGITRVDWSQIIINDQDDEIFGSNTRPKIHPVVGTGVFLDSDRGYLGLSAPYLVRSRDVNGFTERPAILLAGLVFKLNPDVYFRPSILTRYLIGSPLSVNMNGSLLFKNVVWAGLGWRIKDAVSANVQFQVRPQFLLGYNYDYTLSSLGRWTSGTHEVVLRYEFSYTGVKKHPRYF